MTVRVPTINDTPAHFDRLFNLWRDANSSELGLTFDFTDCRFLGQNAVAFLGGLARLMEERIDWVRFNWDTLRADVRANLAQNGFLTAFGVDEGPWVGNSIPYREDPVEDVSGLINYLKAKWMGRDWVHVSSALQGAIVGRVWEIYANAFQHSESPVGVVTCGQHFPSKREMKLTVVDFGVGIPSNVRFFFQNHPQVRGFTAAHCLRWAFRPGTSTRPNGTSRGMGLDLLKQFVQLNKGSLEVFSHDGYAVITEHGEEYRDRQAFFEGTIVNITLKCDESYYRFASEAVDKPLFT